MVGNEEDDDIPATQPVMSLLLQDVVAYVEVRSGHDNRSRGVKTHLRNLGAKVEDTFTKHVTHVVFNEGLPSTYKKAKKLNCHLVSVLWIEACKEALTKVSEAGYPPLGLQIYENPQSLKNFKKLKSMQPDFDDEEADMKLNKIRKRMQRRQAKFTPPPDTGADATDTNPMTPSKVSKLKDPKKKPVKKGLRKGLKGVPEAGALQEITPDVINKSATCSSTKITTNHTQNVKVLCEPAPSVESVDSSQSGIFCGEQEKAGPSKKNVRKAIKPLDDKPITRNKFLEGLNSIALSMSKENELKQTEVSPWRRRLGPPPIPKPKRKQFVTNQQSPRRSPRNTASPSDGFVLPSIPPRQSPRVNGIGKLLKKNPVKGSSSPACISASATLRKKKFAPLPTSYGDNFMLLSQEPGDMPSVEEMAKIQKGSINVGGEHITLSQIVRSYNAAAQGVRGSPAGSSRRSSSNLLQAEGSTTNQRTSQEDTFVDVEEDVTCDSEMRQCNSRCSSEAGSTVSSTSTKVLINGKPPSDVASCSSLPNSGEIVSPELNSPEKIGPLEEYEREPSPIFVIKKAKFRKPLKKPTIRLNQSSSTAPHSQEKSAADTSAHPDATGASSRDITSSLGQKRYSLNPVDYINKLLLPKFLIGNKTPSNVCEGKVLVEETPDNVCMSSSGVENLVIPPTPHENSDQSETLVAAFSPNQSLTNSVISWVKQGCKVPLFSSRSSTPVIAAKKQTSPCKSPRKSPRKSPHISLQNQEMVPSTLSKSRGKRKAEKRDPNEEFSRTLRKSSLIENGSKSLRKASGMRSKVCSTKKARTRRGKVVATVEKNNVVSTCDANNSKLEDIFVKSPPAMVKGPEEGHSSSGYETSNSIHSIKDSAASKSSPNLSALKPTAKRPKITDLLSPILVPHKDRSEIYESGEMSTSPAIDKIPDNSDNFHKRLGRKRTKSVPDFMCKKQKPNNSDPWSPTESKTIRACRVDSKTSALSPSDLSSDSIKSSGRKSSEEAKKRLAVSLTRNYKHNTSKVIVCTFLTKSEQNGIETAGERLQGWKFEEKVTSRTTHVINSGPKRTLNMLKGMARGCWLVDQKWMLDSSKAGTWLEEEKYELVKFSPAVRLCRVRRQAMGKEFKHTLFARAGGIFVSPKINGPPAKDIRELLELCAAELKASPQEAKIVISNVPSPKGTIQSVHPCWVLDSITQNKVLPISKAEYQIN